MSNLIRHKPYTASGNNAVATIDLPALPGSQRYEIEQITFSYDQQPMAGLLTVDDGGQIVHSVSVTSAGAGPYVAQMSMTPGNACAIKLAAGGAGVLGQVNAIVSVTS